MRYILHRLIVTLPTLVGALTVLFLVLRLLPGDPAELMVGDYASEEEIAAVRHDLGLDRPIWEQYVVYLTDTVQLDFGNSYRTRQPVMQRVLDAFPHTLALAAAGLLWAGVLGVLAGITASLRRNTILDYGVMATAMLGMAMPIFTVGIFLILIFSVRLGWLPVIGAGEFSDPLNYMRSLILPSIAVGSHGWAIVARVTRSSVLETMSEGYVRTARAKGLAERSVVYGHVMRNALIPVVTILGVRAIQLLGGTVITETLFVRPGVGRLLVESIFARDYTQIQGTIAFFVVLFVLVNLLVDLCYGLIDPRIRQARSAA